MDARPASLGKMEGTVRAPSGCRQVCGAKSPEIDVKGAKLRVPFGRYALPGISRTTNDHDHHSAAGESSFAPTDNGPA